ncbi:receptor-like protein 35 [Prosopis cineraria]|uniref:receptor-like protein 35 n=1 Tax=Prosopis cineraria TaxID=364024 RepID=UPI00241021F6|nr:receptor-like protein 35 [Prosopis cineraria]
MAWFSLSSVLCLQLVLMHSFSSSFGFPSCRPDQSSALLHFKNSFSIIKLNSDPSFESYYIFFGCEDDNIIPYSKTLSWRNGTIVACGMGRLQGKILADNSLFRLTHLQRLDLAGNDFKGSQLLSNFSQFVSLTHLRLGSGFSGEVSPQISHLNKLVSLDLPDYVSFKPKTWERLLKNATQIEDIWLYDVDMSSISPSHLFKNLSSSLISLTIAEAGLQGHLGDEIFCFPHIQEIVLAFNKNLTGYLPKSNWSNSLQGLNLASCQFTGEIPKSFWNHTQLIELELSNNDFVGQVSPSLSNLQNLTRLSLSSNNFNGPFPSSISKLRNLEYVGLDDNGFQGHLPNEKTGFPLLTYLYLHNNLLNGTIPSWCFSLPSLEWLDISTNQFTGSVQLHHMSFKYMQCFELSNNSLQGELTASICNATSLGFLSLSYNHFTGTIPHCISSSLEILNLSHNKLAFLKLTVLDLLNNNFSGLLPATFFKSFKAMRNANEGKSSLRYMGYGNGSMGIYQDSIEVIMKGLDTYLEKILIVFTTIDVSNNMFEGKIPQVIRELGALKGLNFSHNQLSDAIASSIGNLRKLESLDLSSNKLIGKIPPQLASLDLLGYLNLSHNELEGCIPMVPHFETFSNDSFKGNKGLRGF